MVPTWFFYPSPLSSVRRLSSSQIHFAQKFDKTISLLCNTFILNDESFCSILFHAEKTDCGEFNISTGTVNASVHMKTMPLTMRYAWLITIAIA